MARASTEVSPSVPASPPSPEPVTRRLPIGAELQPSGGAHFRVWAPRRQRVAVVINPDRDSSGAGIPLAAEPDGYFSLSVPEARRGDRYAFRLDGSEKLFPDPASRFQPDGPHGSSQIVDPGLFEWTDGDWSGLEAEGQIIYELHVGTFTPKGTWAAAARELPVLAELGITTIEMMPVADFPGRFGWGYDGVDLFAPSHLYGGPDDLRRFVDAAHRAGLAVILDVVYNHFGPDGNYLPEFSADYRSQKHSSDWGETPNFDGPNNGPVREFVVANAGYWIDEYHFDGLRLDATQQIFDESPRHILADLTAHVHRRARLPVFVVAENEVQDVRLLQDRREGGYGITALWNDDFHHAAKVALTGRAEAYYSGYAGSPQEFVSAARHGFLYQGEWYAWQRQRRGTSSRGIERHRLVTFLDNHDQVANSAWGQRCHEAGSPGCHRALTALLLLAPQTPLLFQGQEYGAPQPFLFFADLPGDLGAAVRQGREGFLSQFPSLATPEVRSRLADPGSYETFGRCRLQPEDRRRGGPIWSLHRDLIRLRREDRVFSSGPAVDGAVLGDESFLLRLTAPDGDERLLVINLGSDTRLIDHGEPLLAPPAGLCWALSWSSEDPAYGGAGTPPVRESRWCLPARSALVFRLEQEQGGRGR